jgi:polyhydroxyalkanoate synthase
LTDPVGSVTTYWDLITNLWDREFVESHSTTSNYLNNMLSYPAGVLQDFLVKVAVAGDFSRWLARLGEEAVLQVNSANPPIDGIDATLVLQP